METTKILLKSQKMKKKMMTNLLGDFSMVSVASVASGDFPRGQVEVHQYSLHQTHQLHLLG